MAAFAQFPRLPRLLRPESLYDTLKRGVSEGIMVIRAPRPDGSAQTWWRIPPDDEIIRRADIEVQPSSSAILHVIAPDLIQAGKLNGLWPSNLKQLTLEELRSFFDGKKAPALHNVSVLEDAIRQAVKRGLLVTCINERVLFREDVPLSSFSAALKFYPPPPTIGGSDLTAQALPEAWIEGKANLKAITDQLSTKLKLGYPIPWALMEKAVSEALNIPLFEIASGSWPCSPIAVAELTFCPVTKGEVTQQMVIKAIEYTGSQTPTLAAIKEAIEQNFFDGHTISTEQFDAVTKSAVKDGALAAIDTWRQESFGSVRVRRPDTVLFGESQLDVMGLQRLAEQVTDLITVAPELNFIFRVVLTVEGQITNQVVVDQLNEILSSVEKGWRLS